jgi:hypothetical protein
MGIEHHELGRAHVCRRSNQTRPLLHERVACMDRIDPCMPRGAPSKVRFKSTRGLPITG